MIGIVRGRVELEVGIVGASVCGSVGKRNENGSEQPLMPSMD